MKIKGNYVNGLKEGIFEYYSEEKYPNIFNNAYVRRLDSTVTFHLVKRNGTKHVYSPFYMQEMLQSSEPFVNNQLHGTAIFWHSSGQIMYTRLYDQGKFVTQTNYKIDSSLHNLDFIISEYPSDTIYSKQFHAGDSLTIEITGVNREGTTLEPLSKKGLKVISFKILRLDSEESFYSEKFTLRSLTGIYNADKLYITKMTIIDPYGFEYKLPDKKIIISAQ